MSEEIYLSDKTMLALVDALSEEIIQNGEAEAQLISNELLTDAEVNTVMKANTLLMVFGRLLIHAVETNDVHIAKKVLNIWTSAPVQEVVQYAFNEEIQSAHEHLAQEIEDLEQFLNQRKENN